jgi:hypothetical protein
MSAPLTQKHITPASGEDGLAPSQVSLQNSDFQENVLCNGMRRIAKPRDRLANPQNHGFNRDKTKKAGEFLPSCQLIPVSAASAQLSVCDWHKRLRTKQPDRYGLTSLRHG